MLWTLRGAYSRRCHVFRVPWVSHSLSGVPEAFYHLALPDSARDRASSTRGF